MVESGYVTARKDGRGTFAAEQDDPTRLLAALLAPLGLNDVDSIAEPRLIIALT